MTRAAALLALVLAALAGCEREDREARQDPARAEPAPEVTISPLHLDGGGPAGPGEAGGRYERNATHVADGKRLFAWFNCTGCHANGGGDSGPALMDDTWIYGGQIANIVATIREGRPNGMPAFRGRIPDEQIWQIAAYVRSMSGNLDKDVAPGRNDDINPGPAESRREPK